MNREHSARRRVSAGSILGLGVCLALGGCADEPVTPPSGFPQQQPQAHRTDRTSMATQHWPGDPPPPDAPLRNVVISPPPALY